MKTKLLITGAVLILMQQALPLYGQTQSGDGGNATSQGIQIGGKDSVDPTKFRFWKVNPATGAGLIEGSVTASVPTAITPVKSTAKEASHVLKSSAGSLIMASGSSDTDQWILIMNAASLPANGAVILLYPPIHIAANGNFHVLFNPPLAASTGIVICNSNANSFTKTIGSADCIFSSQVQ